VSASRLRLRPILMTSFAFILGVVPLVVATGAGAEMRQSLGTAVFSGMLGVTLFGIFVTPAFFYTLQGLSELELFGSRAVRRIGSFLVGGLSGFAVGFLAARIAHVGLPWEGAIGGTAALFGSLLVMALERIVRRRAPRAPAPPEEHAEGQSS
jgi:multidrug efflux pump